MDATDGWLITIQMCIRDRRYIACNAPRPGEEDFHTVMERLKAEAGRRAGLAQRKQLQEEEQKRLKRLEEIRDALPDVYKRQVFPRFQGFNHQRGCLSGRDQVEYAVFQQAEETGSGFPAHVQVFHMDDGIVCFQ